MIKKAEKLSEISSLDIKEGMIFTIWRDNKIPWLTVHGDEFEILWEKFKFKKWDEIHIVDCKKIILSGGSQEQNQIKFKVKRNGEFIKNSEKKKIRSYVPEPELQDDMVLEYNGVIFAHRFDTISNLREVVTTTKDQVWEIV